MELKENSLERIIADIENLAETHRDLATIRMVEHTSRIASLSAFGILILIFILCILFLFGLGTAWWLGEKTGSRTEGFFIVGGVYLVLLIILLSIAKKYLIPALRNKIIRKVYEQDQ